MFKAPRLLFLIFAVILACVYASAGNDSNAIQPIPKKPAAVIKKVEVKPVIINKLQIAIDDWVRLNTGDYGIGVREITGPKRTASYQSDKQFVTASTYKLFLVYVVLHAVENQTVSLNKIMLGDKSVLSCIDSMLVYSDNDCSLPMGRTVGWSKIDGFLHDQGFKNTYINNYDYSGNNYNLDKLSTAKDEVDLAYRLNAGTLLNKENTEIMLSRMKRQVWRERIPAGLPAEIIVADKPGWLENIQNDTAIVYGARSTYIISIMSIGSTVTKLADLSRVVYETLN